MMINRALQDIKRLDQLSYSTSAIHAIDARAKVATTIIYILCVVSFNKYEISALFPFFVFPITMIALGSLPLLFLAKKIALLLPFVLIVGAFNPLLDHEIILQFGSIEITGGWVSYVSILIRSILTIGAAFCLVCVTGFTPVCHALERLGIPQIFAAQLLFLYRYIFVLAEEGNRAARARELRSCGKKGLGIHSYTSLAGHLLLRTWQRAERIHMAMLARGFSGEFHVHQKSCFRISEFCFVTVWSTFFIFARIQNVPQLIGKYVAGVLS